MKFYHLFIIRKLQILTAPDLVAGKWGRCPNTCCRVRKIDSSELYTKLISIPGHKGISINEQADFFAGNSTNNSPLQPKLVNIPDIISDNRSPMAHRLDSTTNIQKILSKLQFKNTKFLLQEKFYSLLTFFHHMAIYLSTRRRVDITKEAKVYLLTKKKEPELWASKYVNSLKDKEKRRNLKKKDIR